MTLVLVAAIVVFVIAINMNAKPVAISEANVSGKENAKELRRPSELAFFVSLMLAFFAAGVVFIALRLLCNAFYCQSLH